MAFYGVHPPMSEETKNKIRLAHLGKKNPKTSTAMMGEKNHMWRGNNVGLIQLHDWIRVRKPKTKLCEVCYSCPPYDLVNTGVYNRELYNWKYMCRRCHMVSDGRINNLKQYSGKKIEFN